MTAVLTLVSSAGAESPAIVIGCPLPLGASYGQNGLRGLTLAAEEINAEGGMVLHGQKRPVKLEIIDTGDLDPKVSESEAMAKVESLIKDKKADVFRGIIDRCAKRRGERAEKTT